jgi:hypothetical protein
VAGGRRPAARARRRGGRVPRRRDGRRRQRRRRHDRRVDARTARRRCRARRRRPRREPDRATIWRSLAPGERVIVRAKRDGRPLPLLPGVPTTVEVR